jgi:hypothetical protein
MPKTTSDAITSPISFLLFRFPLMSDQDPDARIHLDATLTTLESGLTTLSPTAARGVIERWLSVLADYPDLNDVATTLGELRSALLDLPIDGRRVGELLARLGARTAAAARFAEDDDTAKRLERLGALLSKGGAALGTSAVRESREEVNASGEPVQQPSSHHGPSPQNAGRKGTVGDVSPSSPSTTTGGQYNPD